MPSLLPIVRPPHPDPSPRERRARATIRARLADNHRLAFLRALEAATDLQLPDPDWAFIHATLETARRQRYHYILSDPQRRHCDTLRRALGEILPPEETP